MFVTTHAATAFIAARSLGLTETESVIAALGATINDSYYPLYLIRKFLGKSVDKYDEIYHYLHSVHTWLVLPPLFALFGVVTLGHTHIAHALLVAWLGYMAHIGIDAVWHREDGGWHSWGVPADVAVHIVCAYFFYGYINWRDVV